MGDGEVSSVSRLYMREKFSGKCQHQLALGAEQGRRAVGFGDAKPATKQVLHDSNPLLPVAPTIELYV
jgi:hypothetical protein